MPTQPHIQKDLVLGLMLCCHSPEILFKNFYLYHFNRIKEKNHHVVFYRKSDRIMEHECEQRIYGQCTCSLLPYSHITFMTVVSIHSQYSLSYKSGRQLLGWLPTEQPGTGTEKSHTR